MYTKRDKEILSRLKKYDNETLKDIYLYLRDVGDLTLKSSIELPMWLALSNTSHLSVLIAEILVQRIREGNTEDLEQFVAKA